MPTLTVALNVEFGHMACATAKALNTTSQAIHAMGQELGQVREAILENRPAIDYLLLKHKHVKASKDYVVSTGLIIPTYSNKRSNKFII